MGLVTGMIEEVIEVVTIGVLVHLEEMIVVGVDSVEEAIEIEVVIVAETVVVIAEPMIGDPLPVFYLQQEMIDEMIAGMIGAVIVEMIGAVIVEMILHRSRLPNVNKVVRKPPKVEMVGLQFLKNKNYDD